LVGETNIIKVPILGLYQKKLKADLRDRKKFHKELVFL